MCIDTTQDFVSLHPAFGRVLPALTRPFRLCVALVEKTIVFLLFLNFVRRAAGFSVLFNVLRLSCTQEKIFLWSWGFEALVPSVLAPTVNLLSGVPWVRVRPVIRSFDFLTLSRWFAVNRSHRRSSRVWLPGSNIVTRKFSNFIVWFLLPMLDDTRIYLCFWHVFITLIHVLCTWSRKCERIEILKNTGGILVFYRLICCNGNRFSLFTFILSWFWPGCRGLLYIHILKKWSPIPSSVLFIGWFCGFVFYNRYLSASALSCTAVSTCWGLFFVHFTTLCGFLWIFNLDFNLLYYLLFSATQFGS